MYSSKFPCPCCGHRVFDYQPGFNQQCPICGWEDSLDQLRFPTMSGSANHVSLVEAQKNYVNRGISERRKERRELLTRIEAQRERSWSAERRLPTSSRASAQYGATGIHTARRNTGRRVPAREAREARGCTW